jgi:hypothetical protein
MDVADRFKNMEDGAAKSGIALTIFGRAGAEMIPMLNQGAEGIRAMREEAVALGVAIDSKTGAAAEVFNDNLTRMGKALEGVSNRLLAELLPAMVQVTNAMVEGVKQSGGLKDEMSGLANIITSSALTAFQTIAVLGSDVAFVFKMVGGELGAIGAQIAALARGDWEGFKLIGREWERDSAQARKDLDDFQKRIMGLKIATQDGGALPSPTGGGEGGGGGGFVPKSGSTEKAVEGDVQAALDGWYEGEQMLAEGFRSLNEQIIEETKAREEQKLQILLDAIDREQEELIRAGQEEIEIERNKNEQLDRLGYTHRQMSLGASKTFFGSMTALMNTNSKKMFEIGKAAAIAETVVNTYAAAMGAYRALAMIPYVGPFLGAAAAAAAIASGMAQVSAIKSQQIGGGGGAQGVFAANPSTGQPAGTPGGDVGGGARSVTHHTIILPGTDSTSTRAVRDMLKGMQEEIEANGGRLEVRG